MIKVLFVCLGNICRSPLAEALFNHKIKELGLSDLFEVDSCGTGDFHIGSQPDSRTISTAHQHGVDIFHACRQLTSEDLGYFDYILAMDKSNFRNIARLRKTDHESKIVLMRNFDSVDPETDVPDPYYGGAKEFQEVFDILDRSLDGLIISLRQSHSL